MGCAQKSSLLSKILCRESCTAVLRVTHPHSENQHLLPIRSFGDKNSAAKEKFNWCRESPCSRLRKTKGGPSAAESHAGEEKPLGRADEGEQAPRGEFKSLESSPHWGSPTSPCGFRGAEEILPMAPWGSSPSHCQLPWEPCGHGITAITVTTSAETLPGPIPSLRGGPGLVDGAELGLLLGTCCAGPLCCTCPGLQVFASSGSCTGQPHHRRVPRGVQAMATGRWNSLHILVLD